MDNGEKRPSLEEVIIAALRAAASVVTGPLRIRVNRDEEVILDVSGRGEEDTPLPRRLLTGPQKRIVAALGPGGGKTGQEIADALGRSYDATRRDLAEMVRLGILTNDHSTGYHVAPLYLTS